MAKIRNEIDAYTFAKDFCEAFGIPKANVGKIGAILNRLIGHHKEFPGLGIVKEKIDQRGWHYSVEANRYTLVAWLRTSDATPLIKLVRDRLAGYSGYVRAIGSLTIELIRREGSRQ